MTTFVPSGTNDASRVDQGSNEVAERLIKSAAIRSADPLTEIDWDSPLDESKYGCSPEWSTLYNTPLWDELTERQRIMLTRYEFSSVMCVGIWFEMILNEMVLRDQYLGQFHTPEFEWALTEIGDECRHSIMFARASRKISGKTYYPPKLVGKLGTLMRHVAKAEWAYGGILAAEEILDVLQRGGTEDERVLQEVRTANAIHVLEEARHMKFAREEVRDSLKGKGKIRKQLAALIVAVSAYFIVISLVSPQVYVDAGLDKKRAVREAKNNSHYKAMMRIGSRHLMEFLDEVGLLTKPAIQIYRRANMI